MAFPAPDGLIFHVLPVTLLRYRSAPVVTRAADMAKPPPTKAASAPANLLSAFPEHLSARLFDHAKPVKLAADEVLFLAGDPGDGCYQVEQGL